MKNNSALLALVVAVLATGCGGQASQILVVVERIEPIGMNCNYFLNIENRTDFRLSEFSALLRQPNVAAVHFGLRRDQGIPPGSTQRVLTDGRCLPIPKRAELSIKRCGLENTTEAACMNLVRLDVRS